MRTGILCTPPGRLALTATDPATFAEAVQDVLTVGEDAGIGDAFHLADGWP